MSDKPQGGLWDEPAPEFDYGYIDAEAAREERAAKLQKFSDNLLNSSPMISGHNLFVEVRSATIDGDQISLSCQVIGLVQRPGKLAVPAGRELHNLKIPARITDIAGAEDE